MKPEPQLVTMQVLELLGLAKKWRDAGTNPPVIGTASERKRIEQKALRQLWATPNSFVRGLEAISGRTITVDLCAEEHTAKAPIWFGPGSPVGVSDALGTRSLGEINKDSIYTCDSGFWWHAYIRPTDVCWCNPDFLRKDVWADRLRHQNPTFLNVPMSSDMEFAARLHEDPRAHLTMLTGRLNYEPPPGIPASTPNGGTVIWAVNFDEPPLPKSLVTKEVMAIGEMIIKEREG